MDSSSPSSPSSVGFPLSENPENSQSLPSLFSTIGIPLHENPQSTQTLPNQFMISNGPTITLSNRKWNEELAESFHDDEFVRYMRGGDCEEPYVRWYDCMYRAIRFGADRADCSRLAGVVRDCTFAYRYQYEGLLKRFAERTRY